MRLLWKTPDVTIRVEALRTSRGVFAERISRTAKTPVATAPRTRRNPGGTATPRGMNFAGQTKFKIRPSAIAAPKIKGGRAMTPGPPEGLSCIADSLCRAPMSRSPLNPTPDAGLVGQISLAESSFKIGFFRGDDTLVQDRREDDGENQRPQGIGENSDASTQQNHAEIHWVAAPREDARGGKVGRRPLQRQRGFDFNHLPCRARLEIKGEKNQGETYGQCIASWYKADWPD